MPGGRFIIRLKLGQKSEIDEKRENRKVRDPPEDGILQASTKKKTKTISSWKDWSGEGRSKGEKS